MARNVRQTFLKMFQTKQGKSEEDALVYLRQLVEDKRYLEDIWS